MSSAIIRKIDMGRKRNILGWSLAVLVCGCGPDGRDDMVSQDPMMPDEGIGDDTSGNDTLPPPDDSVTTLPTVDQEEPSDSDNNDSGSDTVPHKIDLLFVIDNSGSTGEEQENLARNFPRLVNKLIGLGEESKGEFGGSDVQIMVTTTDFGNPLCSDDHHAPERGAPVTTSCTERIEHFTSADQANPIFKDEACNSMCSQNIELEEGWNFIAFSQGGDIDNIKTDVETKDIDGDGTLDGPAAQALACIGPQGIDGCGFESPLESMMQALNPGAEWNKSGDGKKPFLRDDATLAIAIITDEADCSVKDFAVMSDPEFMREKQGKMTPSSSICWDAGVVCDPDPDNPGYYTACRSSEEDKLHNVSRYTGYLVDHLLKKQKKDVVMLGILGIPEVTKYTDEEPKVPVEGGINALEYRDWVDMEYPAGDILPEDWADGERADHKQWAFGVGPGCTGAIEKDGETEFIGQAIPPVRIREVCEALDAAEAELVEDEKDRKPRCCMESICDDDFSQAIDCLVQLVAPPPDIG